MWRLRRWWWSMLYTLDGWLPAPCRVCGRWVQRRKLSAVKHRVAGATLICADCRRDVYGG